jgi:hypothetical protein
MTDRRPEPTLDTAFDSRLRERASASPDAKVPAHRATSTLRPAHEPSTRLRDVQAWVSETVTRPLDAGGTRDAEHVVTSGPRMSAVDRIDLYRWGYHARLVECLADDSPAVQSLLGPDEFEKLCHHYVAAHPSTSPSLNYFGRHLADFAKTNAPHGELVSELARLEWALVEMIHAPPAPVLALAELQTIAPEAWANARLPASGTVRILRFQFPINRYFQSFRDGDAPTMPSAEPSVTAVYRRGFVVWRMDLTPAMAGLVDALFSGATLGEALATIAVHAEDAEALAEAERNVMLWFREWVAGGFFARIELAC